MNKVQAMVAAMCEAAATYGIKHDMDNNEVINALAHTYVIYGFSIKKEDADEQVLGAALVECVSKSCDRLMEANADAKKA